MAQASSRRPLLGFVAPTPPPWAGPEVATQNLLDTGLLQNAFDLFYIRSNISSHNKDKGRPGFRALGRLLAIEMRLLGLVLRRRPRVVYMHLSQNTSGFLRDVCFAFLLWLFHTPCVAHFHGGNFGVFYRSASTPFKALIRWTMAKFAKVIVLAERFKADFLPMLSAERLTVVYNGVPIAELEKQTVAPASERVQVLYLGALSASKGTHVILEAARSDFANQNKVLFTLAGEPVLQEANILIAENGQRVPRPALDFRSSAALRVLPPVYGKEKERLFREASLFVLLSYSEGMPLAILEAMSYGLPLIVTPVGALPEILNPEENALFVSPGSVPEFSAAVRRLAQDPALRQRMSEANRRLALERFSIQRSAHDLSQALLSVIR